MYAHSQLLVVVVFALVFEIVVNPNKGELSNEEHCPPEATPCTEDCGEDTDHHCPTKDCDEEEQSDEQHATKHCIPSDGLPEPVKLLVL